ncbi:hypothetical protein AKG07_05760 [Microbacterium sp. CGR1]|nr:hypothetical protein AKG07_05760 [Microbacterium sp. CGR1]
MEGLEDESECLRAVGACCAFFQCGNVLTIDQVISCRRSIEQPKDVEQCRLATTRFTQDGDVAALRDLQVDAAQRVY